MPPTIQNLPPEHHDRALDLLRQLYPELSGDDFARRLARMQDEDGYALVGLYDDGHLIGVAGFVRLTNLIYDGYLWVHDLVIDETRRGHGLGRQLMEHLHAFAVSEGRSYVALATHRAHHDARRFYEEKLGYECRGHVLRKEVAALRDRDL